VPDNPAPVGTEVETVKRLWELSEEWIGIPAPDSANLEREVQSRLGSHP
jgi:hypothetical protein